MNLQIYRLCFLSDEDIILINTSLIWAQILETKYLSMQKLQKMIWMLGFN